MIVEAQNTHFVFDPVAQNYDRCNHLFSLGIDRAWRKRLVRLLEPKTSHCILDLCCGTGDLVFSFLRHSPVRDITGLDLSEPMIFHAQEKQMLCSARKWMQNKTVRWHLADAINTGLEDKSFDIITCAFGIRNIPDTPAALTEIKRILKPKGTLCILEFSLPAGPVLRRLYTFYLNHIMPAAGRWILGKSDPLKYLARSIHHWHTESNFPKHLKDAGFTLTRKHPLTAGIVTVWIVKNI